MAKYEPAYRARVYAPRNIDRDETTLLSARDSSDEFLVTTLDQFSDGVGTWKPYLELLRGRRGSVDVLKKETDTGRLDVTIFDVRTTAGGSNAERWLVQFFGDTEGIVQLLGCKIFVEESVDGGSNWTAYFTGRINAPQLKSRIKCTLSCRDMGDEFESIVLFGGQPHPDITYAAGANFFPTGPPVEYGGRLAAPLCQGIVNSLSVGVGRWIGPVGDYEGFKPEHLYATNYIPNVVKGYFKYHITKNSNIRIAITVLTGAEAGATGQYQLEGGTIGVTGNIPHLSAVIFDEVSDSDLYYIPFESMSVGERVEFRVFYNGTTATEVGEAAKDDKKDEKRMPLMVSDVNPVTFARHICSGSFGLLFNPTIVLPDTAEMGDPIQTIAYNSASFAEVETRFNDEGITGRWTFEKPMKAKDWFTKEFGQTFNIAHYFNGDGELTLIDMRRPTGTVSDTITNSDMVLGTTPRQLVDKSKTITQWKILTYAETQYTGDQFRAEYFDTGISKIDISPTFIEQFPQYDYVIYPRFVEIGDRTQKIEGSALRAWWSEDGDQSALLAVKAFANSHVIEELGPIYAFGVTTYEITVARTSNTNDCNEGSYRILDIDEIIDPITNKRGGQRVAICTERYNDGASIKLKFLDLGPGTIAFPPTSAGTLQLQPFDSYHNFFFINVTPYEVGDRISFHWAATATSVGTRPASDSELWTFGRAEYVFGTTDWLIKGCPSNSRIWARLRTEVSISGSLAPSEWQFPSTNYLDTDTYPTPGTVTTSDITGGTAKVTWTNPAGSEQAMVEVMLDEAAIGVADLVRLTLLPPGSDNYTLIGMVTSSVYTFGVRYTDMDSFGGSGPTRKKEFTTSGSYAQAPRPVDIIVI